MLQPFQMQNSGKCRGSCMISNYIWNLVSKMDYIFSNIAAPKLYVLHFCENSKELMKPYMWKTFLWMSFQTP